MEKIVLERFPGSIVTWADEDPGFIVLEIPEADYGSTQDIDANGLPVGPPEPGDIAVILTLEARLKGFIRERRGN